MFEQVPSIDYFRPAALRVLSDGKVRTFRQLALDAARYMQLTDEAMAEVVPTGQPRYENRMNWACSALVKAGLLVRPKRGSYEITDLGRIVDARNLTTYAEKELVEWPLWRDYQAELSERHAEGGQPELPIQNHVEELEGDPMDQAIELTRIHNASIETELRRKLQEGSPTFFEKSVVDLLWAMGYGGAHGDREHVGRSGDGGIDGVIRQDALGLNKVYIQAKRYADGNNVGRPAIQQFFGSLSSRGADRGVFITTSRFSEEAKREAEFYRTIILIDGIRLTKLMLEYGVGVQPAQKLTLFEVDEDYFDADLA